MADLMTFPNTVEEFMDQYKIVDTEQIYTNGVELVPIFRMKQWFEHLPTANAQMKRDVEKIVRCKDCSLNENGKCRLLVERDPNTDHRIWSEFFCAYGERK